MRAIIENNGVQIPVELDSKCRIPLVDVEVGKEINFDKVLLERQKRREGPIVRFSEDGFWEGMKRQMTQFESTDHDLKMSIKTPQAAPVTPFQETKTISTPILKEQFEHSGKLEAEIKKNLAGLGYEC